MGTVTALDTETLPPLKPLKSGKDPVVLGLTIVCHPDPGRIGEHAHLEEMVHENSTNLSRVEPEFRHPGQDRSRPLADPFLSRKPLILTWVQGGLEISGEVEKYSLCVAEQPVKDKVFVEDSSIDAGVTIELSGRIVLLLHFLGMPRQPSPDLGLVGSSEAIEKIRWHVRKVAQSDTPVLIRGQSGTGKELVAQAIHQESKRKGASFVSVNMAAIPLSTAASGLFGHLKGAFTGATQNSEGFFGRAHEGTLFLDEIGDTPVEVQTLLLRALESGEIQPVGAQNVKNVDVRLVAATESDLDRAVEEGTFRAAFLHRLAGYEIRLPSLKERRDDIARLFIHFFALELETLGLRHRLDAPAHREIIPWLQARLVCRLINYDWPGNVRQLRNVARHIALSSQDSPTMIFDETVERLFDQKTTDQAETRAESSRNVQKAQTKRKKRAASVSDISDDQLVEALRACNFRPGRAAQKLGIGRTTLYKLIDKCPAIRKASDISDEELRLAYTEHSGNIEAIASKFEVSHRALLLRIKQLKLI